MTTKSITQNRAPRPRAELDSYTGKPDVTDEHPLITCAPHVLGGHAHLKASKTTVERVLLAELRHVEGPITLSSGLKLTEEERRAVYRYAIAIFQNLSKLYAELGRLQAMLPKEKQP
jgi:uncharacterized protein (DUF433 family)